MAKMTKTTKTIKTTKKIATPVEAEETPTVETTAPEIVEETRTDERMGETYECISLNEAFMAQVDKALENSYKLYERKSLTRQEIQSIANSVLR